MRTEPWGVISRTLVRTDKNGTKYYTGIAKCDRCGGLGGGDQWEYTGWTCYKCGGKGQYATEWCERTEEYQQKLDERRVKRNAKRAENESKNEAVKACKSIATCNERKGCGCEDCPHKVYCNLLSSVLIDLGNAQKEGVLTDEQTAVLERLQKVDRTEKKVVRIVTLDGEPCEEGKWFDDFYGNSKRVIIKPNGEKIYTSATSQRGLAKYGVKYTSEWLIQRAFDGVFYNKEEKKLDAIADELFGEGNGRDKGYFPRNYKKEVIEEAVRRGVWG